ncbi:MAG: hypothetical protein ACXW4T_02080 [Candidatus Limnocylindrales bacterium]
MGDPTRRSPDSWPRDRPIRWGGLARNMTWFVVGSAAALIQLALVVPLLLVTGSPAGAAFGGAAGIGLALVWGGLTLFAAWSWVLGRWRVVAAPVVTAVAILLGSGLASG